MLVFPNCKINLGLNIVQKRPDGFHDLETCFYPVKISDALEILAENEQEVPVQLSVTGTKVNGADEDNLCVKAYHLIKKDHPEMPPVKLYLHKAIPMGAGLGGGSADAAFTLKLLNDKFQLHISNDKLAEYALQLGSDCPFFLYNQPAFAMGRGEKLQPVTLDLMAFDLVIVNPGIHINTGWAFSKITPAQPEQSILSILSNPITEWKNLLRNGFEVPVFQQYPEIAAIKQTLYDSGAVYAAMSGSGSTVFGIFEKNTFRNHSVFPDAYLVKCVPA